jgi:hypothetical protein
VVRLRGAGRSLTCIAGKGRFDTEESKIAVFTKLLFDESMTFYVKDIDWI